MTRIEQLRERRKGVTRSIGRLNTLKKRLPNRMPLRAAALKAINLLEDRLTRSRAKLSQRIADLKAREGTPGWLPPKYAEEWKKPWEVGLDSINKSEFKEIIWSHGYVSPNIHRSEAASKDGQPVPSILRNKCQFHAFVLERVRHRLGDKPIHMLSWYRSPAHNAAVGGVSNSQHLEAWATDWSDAERVRLGSAKFNVAMNEFFANGGRGYYQNNIRHVDNGTKRTWTYSF